MIKYDNTFLRTSEKQRKKNISAGFMNAWKCVITQQKCSELCSPGRGFLNKKRVLVHLNLHTYTPRQLLIRARNRSDVCSRNRPNPRESNSKASHVKAESEHRSSKRRSNFTGAEVEVLLQDEDVSILFHYGYQRDWV